MLFLNQLTRKNGRRNIFMTKSSPKNVPDAGMDLGIACIPSGMATYRATAPSLDAFFAVSAVFVVFYKCPFTASSVNLNVPCFPIIAILSS